MRQLEQRPRSSLEQSHDPLQGRPLHLASLVKNQVLGNFRQAPIKTWGAIQQDIFPRQTRRIPPAVSVQGRAFGGFQARWTDNPSYPGEPAKFTVWSIRYKFLLFVILTWPSQLPRLQWYCCEPHMQHSCLGTVGEWRESRIWSETNLHSSLQSSTADELYSLFACLFCVMREDNKGLFWQFRAVCINLEAQRRGCSPK